jgi:hypothetical protein
MADRATEEAAYHVATLCVCKVRPQDGRKAVLAWNYWCNLFATEIGDRRTIVARLKQLRELPWVWQRRPTTI